MSNGYWKLRNGSLLQDWSDTSLITTNGDWSGVASIQGFRGDDITSSQGVDPRVLRGDGTVVLNVIANQTNPNSHAAGFEGLAEFEIADPVVALRGSSTADAPHLVLYLDATGRHDIRLQFNARDIDGSGSGNAVQPLAVQWRSAQGSEWSNLEPNGYAADVTTTGTATQVTAFDVTLTSPANGKANIQIRIMTTNAVGTDEWVGIDDIRVTSTPTTRHDFTGEGMADILWRNTNGDTYLYAMNGTQIVVGGGFVGNVAGGWSIAGAADFDNDGKSDILWRNTNGDTWLYVMNGAQQADGSGAIGKIPTNWSVAGIGDFTGDGCADILWRNTTGETWLYAMNGPQVGFGGGSVGTIGLDWSVAGVADFTGDGRADILWRNINGDTWIYAMNGAQIIAGGGFVGNVGGGWSVAGVADFTGDRRADILWRNVNGDTYLYAMDGAQIVAGGGFVANVGGSWSVAAIDDYTGDGRADILWRNTNGDTWLYAMNGAQIIGGGFVGNIGSEWSVVA